MRHWPARVFGSVMVIIWHCHCRDPGSIPGQTVAFFLHYRCSVGHERPGMSPAGKAPGRGRSTLHAGLLLLRLRVSVLFLRGFCTLRGGLAQRLLAAGCLLALCSVLSASWRSATPRVRFSIVRPLRHGRAIRQLRLDIGRSPVLPNPKPPRLDRHRSARRRSFRFPHPIRAP